MPPLAHQDITDQLPHMQSDMETQSLAASRPPALGGQRGWRAVRRAVTGAGTFHPQALWAWQAAEPLCLGFPICEVKMSTGCSLMAVGRFTSRRLGPLYKMPFPCSLALQPLPPLSQELGRYWHPLSCSPPATAQGHCCGHRPMQGFRRAGRGLGSQGQGCTSLQILHFRPLGEDGASSHQGQSLCS